MLGVATCGLHPNSHVQQHRPRQEWNRPRQHHPRMRHRSYATHQGGRGPCLQHTRARVALRIGRRRSLLSRWGQGTSYGTGKRDDEEPSVVVGMVEEIEEIPRMPQLAE